ncbi:MAG: DUF1844 domain-containing protein [Phycisphaeraceae bacterium]|nr:DUF1844 domain-containing protein [Phycisphaeraceae bacterium]
MTQPPDEPRLQVDADWKAQAQAEKERLAKIDEERASREGARGTSPEGLPPADFRSLVGILASQAMSGLGAYGDEKGRVIVDPIGAKFAIDLLAVLEEKTKGNLTPEESKDLEGIIRELRMRFVQIMQLVARQGEIDAAAGQGGAAGPGSASSAAATPAARPPAKGGDGGPRLIVP